MDRQNLKVYFLRIAVLFSSINLLHCLEQQQSQPRTETQPWPTASWKTIRVSSQGKDNQACWSGSFPCKTIKYATSKGNLNNTLLVLSQEVHKLDTTIFFDFVSNFKLTVDLESSASAIINCTKRNSGMSFGSSENIILSHVSFENCGAGFPSTNIDGNETWNISTALYMKKCTNVCLLSVRLTKSYGVGAVFYDVYGEVNFNNVYFEQNKLVKLYPESGLSSGGGIYIEFLPKCHSNSKQDKTTILSHSSYTFQNCHFLSNTAEYEKSRISESNCKQFISFGRGGGMSYIVRGNATNNTLKVINSKFADNTALWGAGIFAEFDDYAGNNSIIVEGTDFQRNTAFLAGGGFRCGVNTDGSNGFNTVSLKYTKFIGNFAQVGAGFSQYRVTHFGETIEKITMEHCVFNSNSADRASAMHIAVSHIYLTSCKIENNTFHLTTDILQGDGTIYCFGSQIEFYEENMIRQNHFTALVLEASEAVMHGTVYFSNNTGLNGGAVSLYAESSLRLAPGAVVHFEYNSASKKGGAIFAQRAVSSQSPINSTELRMRNCFFMFGKREVDMIDPDKSNTSTYFKGNTAYDASGKNIYATTISMCRRNEEPISNNSAFKWKTFHYGEDSAYKTVVTSPRRMEIIRPSDWNAYPGLSFSPKLFLHDENCNQVYGNIRITILPENKDHVKLPGSQLFVVKEKIPSIMLLGSPGEKYKVQLETIEGAPLVEVIDNLKLRDCPAGFYFDKKSSRCLCVSNNVGLIYGVTRCDSNSDVYILRGRWGNPKGQGKNFARHYCPLNYCKSSEVGKNDLIDHKFHPQDQCEDGRNPNSTLCGECKKGLSVNFGDEKCKKCDNSYGLFYLLLLVVVIALFVLLIMLVNVDTYSTSLNAFLYSYQIIPLCTLDNRTLDAFIYTAFSLINISGTGKMKLGVCLWENMDDLDKMLLNYLIPTFLILWTLIIAAISYRFDNRCTFNRRTTFRAFVFISVLAYADFTRITFNLLHPVEVDGKHVLAIAGNIEFFSERHIPYAVVAILVLVFIVILFPLILIFSHHIVGQPAFVRLMGIFDTFQEPFQNLPGYRFFSAFYFINRVFLLLIYTYVPHGCLQDTIFAIVCILVLIVFAYIQPYRNQWMNRYDTLLLCNIAVMSVINAGLNGIVEERLGLQTAAHVLSYLPLACLVVKLAIWTHRKWRDWQHRFELERRRGRYASPFPQRAQEENGQEDNGYVQFQDQA